MRPGDLDDSGTVDYEEFTSIVTKEMREGGFAAF